MPSLPGLACPGWRDRPGLVVPISPFPLLTGLGLLLDTLTGLHKGLSTKVGLQEIHALYYITLSCIEASTCYRAQQ